MPSRLFRAARASLSKDERKSFLRFAAWLRRPHGGRFFRNLQAESHLAGDKDFGDPEEFASFLKRCVGGHTRARSAGGREASYDSACRTHELRGLPIPRRHLPDQLLRYCTSERLAMELVGRILGATAREEFREKKLEPEDAFDRMASLCAAGKLTGREKLAPENVVFATFEHPAGAPRDDAPGMVQALAFSHYGDMLYEFAYPTDSVANARFPTVADAGRRHPRFHPAPEVPPDPKMPETCTGWTRPLGRATRQPELVHRNEPLRILSGPPRYVGRTRA